MSEFSDENNLEGILGWISGTDANGRNFRSEMQQPESPVARPDEDTAINRFLSHRTAKRLAEKEAAAKRQPTTADNVLRRRAERAQAPAEGIAETVLPQSVIDYLGTVRDALDMHADAITTITGHVIEILEKVDALEESVAEAKPKPKPTVSISLDAALFGGDVDAMGELLDELEVRIERIRRRREETGR